MRKRAGPLAGTPQQLECCRHGRAGAYPRSIPNRPAGGVPAGVAAADGRWFAFAPGATASLSVREPEGPERTVGVWTCSLRSDRVVVVAPGHIEPGTPVSIPLQTIDAAHEPVTGVVDTCEPIRGGEHRTHVRFDHRITPARYAVCWGVVIDPDGSLIEITAIARRARPDGRPRRRTPRPGDRSERAAHIVTVATDLARRAAEGADDAELREIGDLLNALLRPEGRAA